MYSSNHTYQIRLGWQGLLVLFLAFAGCVQPPDVATNASGNRPPVITRLSASPSSFAVGTTSTISVVVTDPDNNPLTYKWTASTGDFIGEGPTVRFTAAYCCAGSNIVEVTVKDNAGGETSQSVDVYIYYR